MNPESAKPSEARRVGRFGAVGVLNTLLDYILFIGLTKALGLPLSRVWLAKLLSGAVAMVNSYFLNKRWVFRQHHTGFSAELGRFLGVTLVGVFVVQLGLVQLFSSQWPQPGQWLYEGLSKLHIIALAPQVLTMALVIKTVAFGLGTLASLIWNYLGYRRVVFV